MSPALILLGHFPPPRGGVAVHLDRLRDALHEQEFPSLCLSFGGDHPGHPDTIVFRNRPFAFLFALLRGASVVHYHTDEADWKSAALFGAWCAVRRQRYMLTLHSFRKHAFQDFWLSRLAVSFAYHRAVWIICISENLQRELRERLSLSDQRVIIIPSFLPPAASERQAPLPQRVETLMRTCTTIVSFNAYAPTMYQGADLYGGDLVLEAFNQVKQEFPEAGLVMMYVRLDDSSNAQSIRAKTMAMGGRVALIEQHNGPFIPVLTHSSIFIRATLNDGGPSLSVLEALSLGVWCVASDAVPRPPDCVLFNNKDATDLARVLRTVLFNVREGKKQRPIAFPDAANALIPLYRSLHGER